MQVVDLHDAARRRPGSADLLRIEPRRRGLHEDAAGRRGAGRRPAQSISPAISSEAIPSARSNPEIRITAPAIAVAMNAKRSVSDVPEGALDVEAAPLGRGEQAGRGEVHRDPDDRDDQDQRALDVGRLDQPPDALVDDPDAEQQQRDPVDLRREDLRPPAGRR